MSSLALGARNTMSAQRLGIISFIVLCWTATLPSNVHARDPFSGIAEKLKPPILKAVERGDLATLKTALLLGANPNEKYGGKPLIMSSTNIRVVGALIRAGADVNARDRNGNTALIKAAKNGSVPLCQVLIAAGADVNIRGEHRRTAIFLASQWNQLQVIDLLLAHGADISLRDAWNRDPVAAGTYSMPVVSALLSHGADFNTPSSEGKTPLMEAVKGHLSVVQALLDAGADPSARDAYGDSALSMAIENGRTPIVRALLHKLKNPQEMSEALALAIVRKKKGPAEALLEAGADVNANTKNGFPLASAAGVGSDDVVQVLLLKGARINARDNESRTALMIAAIQGHASTVQILLNRGADASLKDTRGDTALLLAEKYHRWDAAQLLSKGRAN